MTGLRIFGLTLAAALVAADQLLKIFVSETLNLQSRGQIHLLPIFDLTWAENRGVSLGMLTADTDTARWLLVALTVTLAAGVCVWMLRERTRGDVAALALILGGAVGNIIDRIRFGYVVDYADLLFGAFRPFLIFNLADACITIGVVILLARALLVRDKAVETRTDHDIPKGSPNA